MLDNNLVKMMRENKKQYIRQKKIENKYVMKPVNIKCSNKIYSKNIDNNKLERFNYYVENVMWLI